MQISSKEKLYHRGAKSVWKRLFQRAISST